MEYNPIIFSDDLVEKLRTARRITILTGAGISAESGIPTFRDSQTGLWANYRPEDLATPQAFQKDPLLVWEWYRWRIGLVQNAVPNAAHIALADLETRISHCTLVTQNIDGLHQKAGSQNVIELHGNLFRARCTRDGKKTIKWEDMPGTLPKCPDCGALLRPDIVWFGEMLPHLELQAALQASQDSDLFFSIGTSGVVEPAASLPYEAIRGKGDVLEINPEPTPLTVHARFYCAAPAGVALPILLRAAWPQA